MWCIVVLFYSFLASLSLAQDFSQCKVHPLRCNEASSVSSGGWSCDNAVDGALTDTSESSWASSGEGVGAFISLSLISETEQLVTRLRIMQRGSMLAQFKNLQVHFSDGSATVLTMAENESNELVWDVFEVGPVWTGSIWIGANSVYSAKDNGFVEVEAYNCQAVWGYFGPVTAEGHTMEGSNHDILRSMIAVNGGVQKQTETLTSSFLSQIDVFFPSLLNRFLLTSELQELKSWVENGGVLIVSAHYGYSDHLASLTSIFGIRKTGFVYGGEQHLSISDSTLHTLLEGIEELYFYNPSDFIVDDFVNVVVTDELGRPQIAVVEDIGVGCGAVLVTAAWHPWHDEHLAPSLYPGNVRFVQNAVVWAHDKLGVGPLTDQITHEDLQLCALELEDLNLRK